MKKLTTLLTASLLAMTTNSVYADELTFKDAAGITPTNVLYKLDLKMEDFKMKFTTNDEEMAKLLIQIAQERLGESEYMMEEGKTELANEALDAYTENMDQATQIAEDIANTEETTSEDSTNTEEVEATEEDTQVVEDIASEIIDTQEEATDILDNVSEDVQDEATKEKLASVIAMQTAKKEAVRNMVQKRHELNTARKELHSVKVQYKKATKSSDEEALASLEATLQEKEAAYTAKKEEFKLAFTKKQEAVKLNQGNKAKKEINEEDVAETEEIVNTDENPQVTNDETKSKATKVKVEKVEKVKENTNKVVNKVKVEKTEKVKENNKGNNKEKENKNQ